ncbi:endoribonuclease LACTB2 [Pelomyxa schiedti]|nr:endoribonuclease LACTB2 [Pelomyxa schiedti]
MIGGGSEVYRSPGGGRVVVYQQGDDDDEGVLRSNTYVLSGEPLIVIDCGFFPEAELARASSAVLIVTHCHGDHLVEFDKYTKRGRAHLNLSKFELCMSAVDGRGAGLTPQRIANDGDIVQNDTWALRVISVPGHSSGSIALWEQNYGLLFSGDTWFGGDIVGCHSPKYATTLYSSVQRLKDLRATLLCAGHGSPTTLC